MAGMNALTGTFRLSCPRHGEARVLLSSFRQIGRLAGTAHPAVYRVAFGCACGGEHAALLTQEDLDVAPLGLIAHEPFVNLMTSRGGDLRDELTAIAGMRIGAGEWPWSFFCYLEDRPRPVTPSSFTLIAAGSARVAVAVACPGCGSISINVCTRAHVDVPFVNDARIGVVPHVYAADALPTVEAFREQLGSSAFDERRLELEQ
ncbi:hypothetical protein Gocc_0949 [Gaiella occulta]|uniref:Uncharacterized protein n=1 Tax=Gaiella occulta TaxID=1002870 RepID=A0A7M2Z036_9ACTN|nr:hypothetical protein [Gaiella occulta]RDI75151.1 hypothetical protein Gocc_0949 [Gaiella occulta]